MTQHTRKKPQLGPYLPKVIDTALTTEDKPNFDDFWLTLPTPRVIHTSNHSKNIKITAGPPLVIHYEL